MEQFKETIQLFVPTYGEIDFEDDYDLTIHTLRDVTWLLLLTKQMVVPIGILAELIHTFIPTID